MKLNTALKLSSVIITILAVMLTGCQPPAVDEPTPAPSGAITADFSASPTLGLAPLEVKFTDQSTGDITSWAWDFEDDGAVDSSERNPSRVFLPQKNGVGAYRVRLTVTGPGGSATVCKHENPIRPQLSYIHVEEAISNVDFSAAHTAGNAPLPVHFACRANTVIDRTEWDFDGDGLLETETGAEHDAIYYEVGARTIPVTAKARGFVPGNCTSVTKNVDITVPRNRKISGLAGGFSGTLDNEDWFGVALTQIGDLDRDGVPDMAVGAFRDDDGGAEAGAVWILFLKADGTVKSHQKISALEGNFAAAPGFSGTLSAQNYFGYGLDCLGDGDGDGVNDLVVGACGDSETGSLKGAVWILFLNSNGTVKAKQKINSLHGGFSGVLDDSALFGLSVSAIGDLDGDGIPDLAASVSNAVWILFLQADGTVKDGQKICAPDGGEALGDANFGRKVSLCGDLNGDTFPDIAVASSDHSEPASHKIWMLLLNADGTVQSHAAITKQNFQPLVFDRLSIDYFSEIGDRDGDGIPDLAMIANSGLFILYMENNGTMKGFKFTGKMEPCLPEGFGCFSVAEAGDLNGDGAADLLVGNPRDSDGGSEGALSCRGAVWLLFLGADGAPLTQWGGSPGSTGRPASLFKEW